MKWRVLLTVLFVVTLFAGFAYLYVNAFVRKHQQAIILVVVDGLDLNLLNQVRQQEGRAPLAHEPDDPLLSEARRQIAYRNSILNLDTFWNVALLSLQQPGQAVPDAGADATAIACGQRVDNGLVAVNNRNEPLSSLIYAAQQASRATGLVTTSSLVDPTPVAFYSHRSVAPNPEENATDLVYSGMDVVLGGGESAFLPASVANESGRRDGRNLVEEATARGYTILRSHTDLVNAPLWRRLFGVFSDDGFYFASLQPADHRQPSLAEMTQIAISNLNHKWNGYFLVVEDGMVARAAEHNFGKLALSEVAEADEAIQSAIDYAGPDALVIVTNSYSLGALATATPANPTPPSLPPTAPDAAKTGSTKVVAPTPPSLPPAPPLWLTGPGGPAPGKDQAAWLQQQYESGAFSTNAPGLIQPQPAWQFLPQATPLAEPAWLAARGEGSSQFRGFFANTDVFELIREQF